MPSSACSNICEQHLITSLSLASTTPTLLSYANANWASNVNDHKLILGYVFTLEGGAISWSSKKQTTVTLFSTKAKYITGAHAAKKAVWLRQLLAEMQQVVNNGALELVYTPT